VILALAGLAQLDRQPKKGQEPGLGWRAPFGVRSKTPARMRALCDIVTRVADAELRHPWVPQAPNGGMLGATHLPRGLRAPAARHNRVIVTAANTLSSALHLLPTPRTFRLPTGGHRFGGFF